MKSISYLRLRSSFWLLKEGGKGKENMILNLKIFIIWGSNPRIYILLSLLEWMDLVAVRCFLQKKSKFFCSIMFLLFYLFGSFRNQTTVERKIKSDIFGSVMFLSLGFLINQTQDDIVVLFCSVYFLSLDFLRNQTWVERNMKRHLCSVSFLFFSLDFIRNQTG